MPREVGHPYPNNFLTGFYQFDAANFRTICTTGYLMPWLQYPESIKLFSFLPGVAITDCIGYIAKSVINLDLWGGVIVTILFFPLFCISIKYFLDTLNITTNQKWYIFFFINFFPTAFFLHLNYTEVYFLTGLLFAMGAANRGHWNYVLLAGVFMSFFRITSLPLGVVFGIWYLYQSYQQKKLHNHKTWPQILAYLPLFSLFATGSLLTFSFYQLQFNDFFLYLRSEKLYFLRESHIQGFIEVKDYFTNNYRAWTDFFNWDSFNQQTGFYFYNKTFRDFFYVFCPVVFYIIGLAYLTFKKQILNVFISLAVVLTAAASGINSMNRYVLHALPILIAFSLVFYQYKFIRYFVLIVSFLLFNLFLILHMRTYWVA